MQNPNVRHGTVIDPRVLLIMVKKMPLDGQNAMLLRNKGENRQWTSWIVVGAGFLAVLFTLMDPHLGFTVAGVACILAIILAHLRIKKAEGRWDAAWRDIVAQYYLDCSELGVHPAATAEVQAAQAKHRIKRIMADYVGTKQAIENVRTALLRLGHLKATTYLREVDVEGMAESLRTKISEGEASLPGIKVEIDRLFDKAKSMFDFFFDDGRTRELLFKSAHISVRLDLLAGVMALPVMTEK